MAKESVFEGFKKFILRGNVVDLAVGVVIGAAFSGVVTAFTKDLLTPLISLLIGKPNFSALRLVVHKVTFAYGDLLDSVISFLLIATVVYFFVILPLNSLVARFVKVSPADPNIVNCPECLSEIHKEAKRCKYCTAQLKSV